jgi:hypothetical protein
MTMVTVNDLSVTDVKTGNTDLAAGVGGGDQLTDHVTVTGTNANDAIEIAGRSNMVGVTGLAATVTNTDRASDTLTVNGRDGNDILTQHGFRSTRSCSR